MVFRQCEVLEQRAVKSEQTRRDQGVSTKIAEHADGRQHKLGCIDIGVRIAFADRITVTTRNQARTKIVPVAERIHLRSPVFLDRERIAGRCGQDSIQLPALCNNALPTVHGFENRKLISKVRCERMSNVEGSQTSLELHVPCVVAALALDEVVPRARHAGAVVDSLGQRVGNLHEETLAQTSLQAQREIVVITVCVRSLVANFRKDWIDAPDKLRACAQWKYLLLGRDIVRPPHPAIYVWL